MARGWVQEGDRATFTHTAAVLCWSQLAHLLLEVCPLAHVQESCEPVVQHRCPRCPDFPRPGRCRLHL